MSSDNHCCVPAYKDTEGIHQVLHMFPNPEGNRERFNRWLYAIGGDILNLENERIYKYRRVCRSHFEEKYLCRNNKISNIAVPTLNMPAQLSLKRSINTSAKRQPLQQILDLQKPSKSSDPISTHSAYMRPTSMNIEKVVMQKENIGPDTLMLHEHNMPLSNLPVTKKSMEQSLREKQAARKNTKQRFLTKAEKELHEKLVAARIKISKMKNKVKIQTANIKAAKILYIVSLIKIKQLHIYLILPFIS